MYANELGVKTTAIDLSLPKNEILIEKSKQFPYCLGEFYPTIIIFKNGKPCTSYLSFRTAKEMKKYITETIVNKPCPRTYVCQNKKDVSDTKVEGTQKEGLEYGTTCLNEDNYLSSSPNTMMLYWIAMLIIFVLIVIIFSKDTRSE
jgi:hypothetical protein